VFDCGYNKLNDDPPVKPKSKSAPGEKDPFYHGLQKGDRKIDTGTFAFQIKTREDRERAESMYHPGVGYGCVSYQGSYGRWCAYHVVVTPGSSYKATMVGSGRTLVECAFNAGKGVLRKIHGWKRPSS